MGGYVMGISSIFPNLLPQVYMKIYMAQALDAGVKRVEAAQLLAEALEMALPDRMYLPFAENYERIKKLLPDCCEQEARGKIAELAHRVREGIAAVSAKTEELTPREKDVLKLLVVGRTNPEIMDALHLSLSTVKKDVSAILRKFGIASRELVKGKDFEELIK